MTGSKEMRRVALFRTNFLPYSETFIHDELCHHVRYRSTVFARQWRNQDRFQGHDVAAVEEIPNRRRLFASLRFAATAHCRAFDRIFKERPFDIVHAHFGHNGIYAMPYALKYKLPLAVSLHGRDVTVLLGRDKYRPAYWHYLIGYKKLFQKVDLFLAASSELKELIVSVGCPEEKVVLHRLGIDVEKFSPIPEETRQATPTVLMVGRFVEKKGHMYGLEAAAAARRAGLCFKLVIVGDGPNKKKYERYVEQQGMQDMVELPGALPHDEVRNLTARARVLMAPSVTAKNLDRESGIIVAKEASACGVPVIGTLHGGIPDIIEDGATGFLVPERDSASLGDRLIRLLKDEDLRYTMGRAAAEKMRREYDIKERTAVLEEHYDRVIAAYNRH